MLRLNVTGIRKANADLRRAEKKLIRRFRHRLELAAQYTHISVTDLTAVWSGKTLANWQWSVDSPSRTILQPKGSKNRADYGQTGGMALGGEPMRAANQAVADASFRKLRIPAKDPFHNYILTNPWWVASLMEAGRAPDKTRARTSQMIRITRIGLMDYLRRV